MPQHALALRRRQSSPARSAIQFSSITPHGGPLEAYILQFSINISACHFPCPTSAQVFQNRATIRAISIFDGNMLPAWCKGKVSQVGICTVQHIIGQSAARSLRWRVARFNTDRGQRIFILRLILTMHVPRESPCCVGVLYESPGQASSGPGKTMGSYALPYLRDNRWTLSDTKQRTCNYWRIVRSTLMRI